MESLVNYESEDELDSDFGRKAMEASNVSKQHECTSKTQSDDTNYDAVGMDLSEDSNSVKDEGHSSPPQTQKEKLDDKGKHSRMEAEHRGSEYHKEEKDRNRQKERYKAYYKEDRNRDRERRKEYHPRKEYRRDREDYRERDRDYKSKTERNSSNDTFGFRDRYRRSVSPRSRKDRKRHQSRSKSRERINIIRSSADNSYNKSRTYDHKALTQTGSSSPTSSKGTKSLVPDNKTNPSAALPSYYNPNIINPNKYAEQAQKRKLLWSNKKTESTSSKWQNAKFAQDADGKVASKFMRLMGIKSTPKADNAESAIGTNSNESIKKREEMFSSMEQQYEVARQVTHTMRGVGLGFSSQSRQF